MIIYNLFRTKGRILITLLIVCMVLAAVLSTALIWVWRALPKIAIAEISELTNCKVETKSIEFKFDGSVLIEELVIRPQQQQQNNEALLRAKTVYARFSKGSMLLLGPRLKEIRVNDFVFDAKYDLDTGRWNLAELKFKTYKNGAGKMPIIHLERGTLQYSKVSKDQTKVIAAVPIDMKFRPTTEMPDGYSFDITTAERTDSNRSRLSGFWQPGRIKASGGISSTAIPAFENAWAIDALNAELNYDWRNNFSLKLKITDLLYTKRASGDTFAFDRPVFLVKTGLFTALQKFFSRYNPTGKIDMDLEVSGHFSQLSESAVTGKVYCKDAIICDQNFPYTIEHMTGQIDFTENSALLNNLFGKHNDTKVTFNGWIKDFGPDQRYQVEITSDNIALDSSLYNALNTKYQELWEAFSPDGLAAISYHLSRQSQTEKKKTLKVELRGAEAAYRNFPYPLKNLTGTLFFDHDSITVSDLVSKTNGGNITINGKVSECNTDRPIYYLLIKANDVPFDPMLTKTLLAKQSKIYNKLDMTGLADADVKIFTPAEDLEPTRFSADLTLKKTSCIANEPRLMISDILAKVSVTPEAINIKNFAGRYGQSPVSLTGTIWLDPREAGFLTNETKLSRYYLALGAQQAQLSEEIFNLLPTPMRKMVSELQPAGKVNISANARKTSKDSELDYNISVECLGNTVNFKRFVYPLKDVTGTLNVTNNKIAFEDITAALDFDKVGRVTNSTEVDANETTIKFNGQIALADNAFSEGNFQLSASDISFVNQAEGPDGTKPAFVGFDRALPAGVVSFYQALSPTGRFDLDLENVKISKVDNGEKNIDFVGTARLKGCNFNMSGKRAEAYAVMKTKGLYKTGSGLAEGQVSVLADNLRINDKSITNLKTNLKYNPILRNWSAENLVADCYGGRVTGKLKLKPATGSAKPNMEYLLQVGFDNIDLEQFLLDTEPPPRLLVEDKSGGKNGYTSGIMDGSLSISAQIGDSQNGRAHNASRLGRCRFSIRDMQVGKLSPLAKLLNVLRLTEPKNYAFERMVVDSYIRADTLLFDEFDMSGETVAFHGSGWMDLQNANINLSLTARGKRLATAEPSFLASLSEGLSQAVVRMEVTGNVHDPKVETKTLPVVEDSLKILGTPR